MEEIKKKILIDILTEQISNQLHKDKYTSLYVDVYNRFGIIKMVSNGIDYQIKSIENSKYLYDLENNELKKLH